MTYLQVLPMTSHEEAAPPHLTVSQLQYQLEIDRRWLSAELDASVGQNLQALSVFLRFLDRSLPADQSQARRLLDDIKLLVQATQDQVDLLRQGLQPVQAVRRPGRQGVDEGLD